MTFSLATIFIIVSSLSFLIHINTIENVESTIIDIGNTTTTTATPPTIEAQNPVDVKTGQIIIPPSEKLIETNPITGQAEVVADIIRKDPVVREGIITTTNERDLLSLGPMNGLSTGIPNEMNITPEKLNLDKNDISDSVNTNSRNDPNSNSLNTNSKSQPTFNPMFSSCDTNQFEQAQYSIIGDFEEYGLVQGKAFSLDILTDIINNDTSKFDSTDYPYKAYLETFNEKIPIDIKKIMTICSDITDLDVIENDEVNHKIHH